MGETTNARWINPAAILVATDLSDLHRVMPFAIQMAEKTGARLQLVHILQFGGEFATDAANRPYYDREGALSCAMNMLQPWCERARRLRVSCEPVVRQGHPAAEEIIAAAREFHADSLLLGTRSSIKPGKLLLGSVAEQVLRSASLPVYTIGPEGHLPSERNDHRPTVLFATSLGEGHYAGAALACQIAASQRGTLIFLHVLPPFVEKRGNGSFDFFYSTIMSEFRDLVRSIGAESYGDVEEKVLCGDLADRILVEAVAGQADLIVMQTDDHPKFQEVLHYRTICRVLAHAQCPVLTLHSPEQRSVESDTVRVGSPRVNASKRLV
jgi:nucleotide-binding universal stress UspA family protein